MLKNLTQSKFQHTAARRRLVIERFGLKSQNRVSTHSRPKAAGRSKSWSKCYHQCFNTQPPEGGWGARIRTALFGGGFNTQPPEGGWLERKSEIISRIRFNTQPPEGGWLPNTIMAAPLTSFQHTAARRRLADRLTTVARGVVFQHTAARRRLVSSLIYPSCKGLFQHTAARRRLVLYTWQ